MNQGFLITKKLIYDPYNIKPSNLVSDKESQEYDACSFTIGNKQILFRTGKTTPTKIGQFVTLWKRVNNGPIAPYDLHDPIDLFIILTKNNEEVGQFIFPKSILYKHGILSDHGQGGKRAMRIYAPWDKPTSKQAIKTQTWQVKYFYYIPGKALDIVRRIG